LTVRRALDALYLAGGWAGALGMIGTLAMVVLGVAGRLLHFHVPGTDAYAGYFMAAAGFLALAYTFKRNEHIRVSLLIERAPPRTRRVLEVASLAIGTLLAALFAIYSVRLAWQSFDFNDISTANDATPLWMPQLAMAAGTLILLVALVDDLVLELSGRRRHDAPAEAMRSE
jgi:TRAP-type C4-dicarboxylate transport system permease small subunit